MFNVHRKGGDYSWMRNNLQESKQKPRPENINALWTFGGKWNPEAKIDALWNILAYPEGK
jgi:hypothetical protein